MSALAESGRNVRNRARARRANKQQRTCRRRRPPRGDALLVPRKNKVEHSNAIKNLTDEQLEAMIEHFKASLEAEAQSVIEGEAVPSLPPPVSAKNS